MYDRKGEANEFVGESRDDAVANAARFFGVETSDLKVAEGDEGSISGLGGRTAIVAFPSSVTSRTCSSLATHLIELSLRLLATCDTFLSLTSFPLQSLLRDPHKPALACASGCQLAQDRPVGWICKTVSISKQAGRKNRLVPPSPIIASDPLCRRNVACNAA